jgi:SOS-response transcriptional repressor LexA
MDGERERAIRRYIEEHIAGDGDGCAPTVEQIAAAFEEKLVPIKELLLKLSRSHGAAAASSDESDICYPQRPFSDLAAQAVMPPIMGTVGAGEEQDVSLGRIDDAHAALADVLGGRDGNFMLQVRGQSMINAGINDNDWAVFQPVSHHTSGIPTEILDGDIVLVEVLHQAGEHGLLLKRVFRESGGRIRLESCNQDYAPRYYRNDELRVNSRLVSWVRIFKPGRGVS